MEQAIDKKDAVRGEIIAAARELFKAYGLGKATMEDIAESAGKGKSTLYYYFKKKEDVFYAVAAEECQDMVAGVEKGLRSARTAAEKLRLFYTIQDNAIRNKAKIYPIVFKETKKHIQLFHRIQRESNTRMVKLFKSILLDGIASGEFGSIRKEDCDTLAVTGVMTMHAMNLTLLLDGKVPSNEDKMGVMLDIFIRGLK